MKQDAVPGLLLIIVLFYSAYIILRVRLPVYKAGKKIIQIQGFILEMKYFQAVPFIRG